MTGENFAAKVFEWAWERGLVLLLVFLFGSYNINKASELIGFEINDPEKGLMITLLALACITLHFFLKYWIAKQKHFSPSSYRQEVVDKLHNLRDLCNEIRLALISADPSRFGTWLEGLRAGLGTAEDVGADDDLIPLIRAINILDVNFGIGHVPGFEKSYDDAINACNDFRKTTSWAAKV